MKKLILLIALAVVFLLAGCSQSTPTTATEPLEPPPELNNKVWISPSKVEVGNFYDGARAEYPLTIHNGNDQPTEFSITFKVPGSPTAGFAAAPEEAGGWVIIADPAPVLAAKETREVLVAVEMPKGTEAPDKWEFWIVAKDASQTGMVQTELACRWLVTMK